MASTPSLAINIGLELLGIHPRIGGNSLGITLPEVIAINLDD